MDTLKIKRATEKDWNIILDIEKSAQGKFYSIITLKKEVIEYLNHEVIFLASIKKTVIGKISYTITSNTIYLSGLVILPTWRGKGYGKLLSQHVISLFPDANKF